MTRSFALLLAAVALAAGPLDCLAEDAPLARPLRLIVPYPPGALTDLLGRTIAERLGVALG